MLKILQFIHSLNMGGAETLVKDYLLGLDKSRFEVILLCYERLESPYTELIEQAGIKTIYVCDEMPLHGRTVVWARVINKIMRYMLVRKYIRRLKPNVIHEHLTLNSYLKFAKPKKDTVIFYTQHFQVSTWKQKYQSDIKAAKWLMERYPMCLIALNEAMKQEMAAIFNTSDMVVLNNGINVERFRHAKEGQVVRQELGIPQEAFVVGHVGRFSQVKNHEFLVDVFAEVAKREPTAYLLMVGKGETLDQISEKLRRLDLEQCSKILSDRTDIPDLMKAMDVLVFPSFSEGMPVTLVEAQMAGLRCVVSDAVSNEVEFSNLIQYHSLNEGAVVWAENALRRGQQETKYYDVDRWDMSKVIRKLERLYEGLVERIEV